MNNKNLIDFLNNLIENPKVKEIQILGWKECGEWAGENPMPIINLKLKDNVSENSN